MVYAKPVLLLHPPFRQFLLHMCILVKIISIIIK
jgi:hypothetical protein